MSDLWSNKPNNQTSSTGVRWTCLQWSKTQQYTSPPLSSSSLQETTSEGTSNVKSVRSEQKQQQDPLPECSLTPSSHELSRTSMHVCVRNRARGVSSLWSTLPSGLALLTMHLACMQSLAISIHSYAAAGGTSTCTHAQWLIFIQPHLCQAEPPGPLCLSHTITAGTLCATRMPHLHGSPSKTQFKHPFTPITLTKAITVCFSKANGWVNFTKASSRKVSSVSGHLGNAPGSYFVCKEAQLISAWMEEGWSLDSQK